MHPTKKDREHSNTIISLINGNKEKREVSGRLVFCYLPSQYDIKDKKLLYGLVREGLIYIGCEVRITRNGQIARVLSISKEGRDVSTAAAGNRVTLKVDCDIDPILGDIITLKQSPVDTTDHFEAYVVWKSQQHGMAGRTYLIKLASQSTVCSITSVKYKVEDGSKIPCNQIDSTGITVCNIATHSQIAFDSFAISETLGTFYIYDKETNSELGIGFISHSLHRSRNIHKQSLVIDRESREKLNGHSGKVFWFTGLSGSGKSTIANELEVMLYQMGKHTYILDGDNIRHGLNKDLGFKDSDRVENIRRIAEVAKLMLDAGLIVITAFISPFRQERDMAKDLIGADNFIEVYLKTPLKTCEQRDPKGLYKKARLGEIPNMTGISSPYEPPTNPNIIFDSTDISAESIAAKIITNFIKKI